MTSESNDALEEGVRLFQRNDLHAAVDRFQEAVQLDPADGQAYGYLGITLAQLGDPDAGIAALQEAARLQPHDAVASYNLAVALMQAHRISEARAALEEALALDPGNTRARAALERLTGSLPISDVQQPIASVEAIGPSLETAPAGLAALDSIGPPSAPVAAAALPLLPVTGIALPAGDGRGMQYPPSVPAPPTAGSAPSAGLRVLRGLGWGALYGQWWTLWIVFWDVFLGGMRSGESHTVPAIVGIIVLLCLVFAVVGSITGLVIGSINAPPSTGAVVGVVAGVLLLGLEYLLRHSGFVLINVFFWFFTGRFIGANIANRVHKPTRQ